MHRIPSSSSAAVRRYLSVTVATLLVAGCVDRDAPLLPDQISRTPAETVTRLVCTASPAEGTVGCDTPVPFGADAIIGGQGYYVRLASSNVSYAGGVFSFDATVQNLSGQGYATEDGSTRHAGGVKVFFHNDVTVTDGTGEVTVANPTGTDVFTGANQPYFQYGGSIGGIEQPELGGDGILSTAEVSSAKTWELSVPATVNTFSFVVYVSTATPGEPMTTMAPQVTGASESPLVPGQSVTLTGINFNATPASNIVTVGGAAATVTAASTTSLTVTVPCVLSGSRALEVTTGGMRGVGTMHTVQVPQRTLAVGAAVIVTEGTEAACNELTPTGAASRYVVAVYSTSTSPSSSTSFQISADGPGVAAALTPAPDFLRSVRGAPPEASLLQREAAAHRLADQRHHELLEKNAAEFSRLSRRFSADPRMRPRFDVLADPVEPPLTRTIRVSNINTASICQNHFTVNATRVYYAGKLAIYEDDATADALKAANNAAMAGFYQAIGDQFNADMEPIIRNNFGDPLRRDASTDNNGVLVALFTPLFASQFPGVAGFVVSCDQFPNDGSANATSNFGEYFYAMMPTNTNSGFGTGTPESWYRTIRSTFIHETKHVASQAARVANGSPVWEAGWLEEGTARHSEELWARNSIYNVAWKGNTGYGSTADFNSIYCDVRPTTAECTAANPRRPSLNMWRHFSAGGIYWWMGNSRTSSPFGSNTNDQAGGNSSAFYSTSWSLVRYAIDRYGTSDAQFLSTLNEATVSGTPNLTNVAGVSLAQLLGGWALALYADDYPGLASPSADIQFPTWNSQSIFTGLRTDFGAGTYPRSRHLLPSASFTFGSLAPISVSGLVGGGAVYYEFTGTQTQAQLIRLAGSGGGALPSTVRVAIARLE